MHDDGIEWAGPPCPECGQEMNAETLANELGIRLIYNCPTHGPIAIEDPFE